MPRTPVRASGYPAVVACASLPAHLAAVDPALGYDSAGMAALERRFTLLLLPGTYL